jgi:CubicO group peptidase (beta-lactamase class C family)
MLALLRPLRAATLVAATLVAATLVAASPAAAPLGAQAPARSLVVAPERLARIDSAFQRAVDRGEIVGAVALVLRDGRPVYERAFGHADREAGRRMTTDAMFRIASQTKALTSVAVMQLAEEGKLALTDPVSRYIPAFARTTVGTRADTGLAVVPARRQITIRDLLTHTAGISYGTDAHVSARYAAAGLGPNAGWGWYTADKDEPICATMERLAAVPFVAQPGERYVYGYATDVLGCVVERASGVPLDEFLRARITGPLGMRDTHFFVPAARRDRLVAVYASAEGGATRAPEGARGQGAYLEGPRKSFSGGAGLVSTARDYARFLQMLLDGGTLDGARVLGPKTVALMTTDQAGPLFGAGGGEAFGLGFRVLMQPGAGGRVESVGTYGWGGAYGSQYLVDPQERLVLVYMVNQLPNTSTLAAKFPMLVYQALVAPRR